MNENGRKSRRFNGRRGAVWAITSAVVIGLSVTVASAVTAPTKDGKPSTAPDPYKGMTNAERQASDKAAFNDFEARYKAWLSQQSFTPQQLAALPKRPMNSLRVSKIPTSLDGATKAATRVASGVVTGIAFEPYKAIVTLKVEDAIKGGNVGDSVTIVQSGGLWPEPDFKTASLSIDEASPLLLPGDRAFVLLEPEPDRPGAYRTESVSGLYRVVDGRVEGVPGNPFGGTVAVLSQAELGLALRAAG